MSNYATTGKPVDRRFEGFCRTVERNMWNKYSQNGEDCIIDEIFKRVQPTHRIVVECGAADGLWFSNSRNLIEQGWKGLLIEGDDESFKALFNRYKADDSVALECRTIQATGPDRFDAVFAEHGLPEAFDLLIIDVDGMDYYLWNSLVNYRPTVVICEYDPNVDPMYVPAYGEKNEKGMLRQAGKDAIRYIGQSKGYECVCGTATNLVFVRREFAHQLMVEGESDESGQVPVEVSTFDDKVNRFLSRAKGVIHVGANEGQERDIYRHYGLPVIWIEAIPYIFAKLQENLRGYPLQFAHQALLTDVDGLPYTMHIANNDAEASSIYDMAQVAQMWPEVKYVNDVSLVSHRLDTFCSLHEIDLAPYDTLILDTQGSELLVLQGAGAILDKIRYVRVEAADFNAYTGGCQVSDLDEFLLARGFHKAEVHEARRESYGAYYEILYSKDTVASPRIDVAAAMSTPRLGFLSTMDSIISSLQPFNIQLARGEGAFWSQTLTRAIEKLLDTTSADYILTIDYDSMFGPREIAQLVMLMYENPDVDVIVPMQQKREGGELLASTQGEVNLSDPLLPLRYGHFGLTLFKRDVFERLPRPWFYEKPDPNGGWDEGRIDADIGFWKNCEDNGIRVMLATDVVIGHLELVVTVPDVQLRPLYMSVNSYRHGARPENMFSRERAAEAFRRALDMG